MSGFDLEKTYQYLLILLAFLMPLTVAGANLVIVIICSLWLVTGHYKDKFNQIINSKVLIASIIFFSVHIIGLGWTQDLEWGFHILHKMWYFIGLFPILYTIVKKDFISRYIAAFLLAIAFTEVVSYLIWFEVIEPFKAATKVNPTPFMTHVSYNPILCIAIYLVAQKIIYEKNLNNIETYLYSFFGIAMCITMFITGGRAGQVMFFAMISILIFQYFYKHKIKAIFLVLIAVPVIFFSAFQVSDIFKNRITDGVESVLEYSENRGSSVGLRISFALNSWQIIKKNPFIGVGTGDFPSEYKKINEVNTPELPNATNPHNMYTLIIVQLGFVGLASMVYFFYHQIKFAISSKDQFLKNTGVTLPILFLVIMLADSYLLGHYTSLVFIFFSSFLYKDFEKN